MQREAVREQYWKGASEYKRDWTVVGREPQLNLHHPASIRYENSRQLVDLGIMKGSERLAHYATGQACGANMD